MVTEKKVKARDYGHSPRSKRPVEESDKKYQHSRSLNRLQYKEQIKPLFDKFSKQEGTHYYGEVAGVNTRIDFSLDFPCTLRAKTEGDLEIAYRKVMRELIGRN